MFACRFMDDDLNEFWGMGDTMTRAYESMVAQVEYGELDIDRESDNITFFRAIHWDTTVKTVFFEPGNEDETGG